MNCQKERSDRKSALTSRAYPHLGYGTKVVTRNYSVLDGRFFIQRRDTRMCENCTKGKYYITTAIAYTSGKPHIGNVYEIVLADSIARYKRMVGYDVRFQTGTDEHGQKIEEKAQNAGKTPKEFVDEVARIIKEQFDGMNISYDKFIRTTDEYHEKQVQKIFKKLYDKGDIYLGEYEGQYCKYCESFFTESQLVDGCCPDCGRPTQPAKEEAYFFRMSKYADRLMKHIEEHPEFIQPESRKNEMVNNFIKPGLQDLCVSRTSFKWGIPVSFDDKHVIYVWIDALSNYITGLGYDLDGNSDPLFDKYWPADVHLVGKEIVRFHSLIWPAMLMALELPLPKHLAVHGWITFNGAKMSKSIGNVVDPFILGERYSPDAIRYHILREMALGSDSSFSNEIMINRINTDLANGLGNLVSRTVAMVEKYFGGTLPEEQQSGEFDDDLIAQATALSDLTDEYVDSTRLNKALEEIFNVVSRANKYIDETTPWILAKDESNKPRLACVLYNLLETIRIISTLLSAFMPSTMPLVWEQIGADKDAVLYDNAATFGTLPRNVTVHKGDIIFPRIDVEKEIEELNKLITASQDNANTAVQPEKAKTAEKPEGIAVIGIEDFMKVRLCAAKIKACEPIKKSKKLLKLTLDDGTGERTVASGIAKYYTPDDLIGKTVILVSNLKPAVLCGVESNGMILAADAGDDVKVIFLDGIAPGSVIR